MRAINFNAGPAGLPLPALERARDELVEFGGSGMSIMEHSHRGKDYEAVHGETTALLTELWNIPSTHQVLYLQGGASLQFAEQRQETCPRSSSYSLSRVSRQMASRRFCARNQESCLSRSRWVMSRSSLVSPASKSAATTRCCDPSLSTPSGGSMAWAATSFRASLISPSPVDFRRSTS